MTVDKTSTLLATGSSDMTIKVWDVDRKYWTHNLKGHRGVITWVTSILLTTNSTSRCEYHTVFYGVPNISISICNKLISKNCTNTMLLGLHNGRLDMKCDFAILIIHGSWSAIITAWLQLEEFVFVVFSSFSWRIVTSGVLFSRTFKFHNISALIHDSSINIRRLNRNSSPCICFFIIATLSVRFNFCQGAEVRGWEAVANLCLHGSTGESLESKGQQLCG